MPVIPNPVERAYMLRLNRGPGPMLDLMSGVGLEAAMLALELDLFDALAAEPATPAAVAGRLDLDETGVATLLTYLDRAGYVTTRGEAYEPTAMTETWLLESAERSFASYFRFWQEVLCPFWREHAADAIRDGEPPVTVYEWLDDHPERWPVAQAAFEVNADLLADDVVERVPLPEDGAVLDVGGGHARYSVAVCERTLAASATVFDDPAIRDIARENVRAAGLSDRIEFVPGDYETDPLPSGFDAVLLFNVVHGNDPETNRALLGKVADALDPGGHVAILDQFGDESLASIATTGTRFLDLTYLVSLGGRTYHTDAVGEWLEAAGLALVDRHEFRDRHMTLLVAEKS